MIYGILVTKIWLISMGLVITLHAISTFYNRPIRGISMKPELRAHNKLLDKALGLVLCVFVITSGILVTTSIFGGPDISDKNLKDQRASFFIKSEKIWSNPENE